MKVIFAVKNGIHISKENKEMPCLLCEIRVSFDKADNGGELKDLVQSWKDFRQVALDYEKEVHCENLNHTENGWKIDGFSIPWNVQFYINQLVEKGYIK